LFYKTILKGPSMTITDPGGNWILACPDSTHARIYRRVGMGLVIVHTWTRNNGGINCAAFSQDGKTILTGSKDHVVRLWTLDGNCREFPPQEDVITSVVFSPNEQRFLSRSNDGTIRLWKMDGSFIELNWPGQICETFFPQGDSILTGSVDGFLRIWDLKGKLRAQFDHVDQIMSVAISPDGENILEGSWNMTAQVLRTRDRHLESTLGHNTPLNLVRFSPDGSQVFVSGYNGNVRIWSMGGFFQQSGNINWVMKAELKDNMSRVRSMGITPEGDTLITASIDGSVRLWDIHRLNEPSDAPPSMSLEEFLHRGAIDSFSTREIDSMTAAPKIRAGKSKPKK
ncbi:MAG TPA: WD40 repeat domain-containing protein, partial [Chitinophagaceae bacterium]|nr:WD40 repeat domain-containing protein [Chitinophagaceae bacterium]